MRVDSDDISVKLPRAVVAELPSLSADLTARMHALLERNTDGELNGTEREELETLVRMAEVAQILSMVASARS
jgi:hypothetical protein